MAEPLLPRKLKLFSLTNIVIGDMIGAGIFTTSGLLLAQLHNPVLLLLLWIVGGAIALSGALSYGELGARFPEAGGDYIFLTRLFTPLAGFLSGWVSFLVGFSAPVAASSLAFSEYLIRILPEENLPQELVLTKKAIAVGIILIFTLIHYFGLNSGSKVQNILTVLKIGLIIVLISVGFTFGEGSLGHFLPQEGTSFARADMKTIGLALMWIMFAYSGWNASTYMGSEVYKPVKNIPRSLIIGTFSVTAIYLLLNVLYVYAVAPVEMEGVIPIGSLAANNLFNLSMDRLFSLFIALILLSAISVLIIIGPRVYFAMAQSGHFFGIARRINRARVPGISILLQSALAIIYVLSGTFEQIITFLSFSLGIFPILVVIGVFKLRLKKQSILKVPGYPLLPAFFILSSLGILGLAFLERPLESSVAIGVVLAGIPAFFLLKRSITY
ncbi:MAG: amino acid permease [Bacteroidales bacterium]|nr:amino acid permease [Bacteroidales bacterium]